MTPLEPGNPLRAEYLKLLELHNANRIDYNTRKWETVKFFEGVYTVLMGSTAVLLAAIQKEDLWGVSTFAVTAVALPIISAVSALLGAWNLSRESRLLFLEEAQVFKLAHFLGLNRTLDQDQRWLAGEPDLLMKKWTDSAYGTKGLGKAPCLDQWLEARMEGHRFADIFAILFTIEAAFSLLIAILVWAH